VILKSPCVVTSRVVNLKTIYPGTRKTFFRVPISLITKIFFIATSTQSYLTIKHAHYFTHPR